MLPAGSRHLAELERPLCAAVDEALIVPRRFRRAVVV
jgi:hypothetical protein